MEKAVPENIELKLPIVVSYQVLESLLQKRLAGEYFQVEKQNGEVTRYAKIIDVSLFQSPLEDHDLAVDIKFTNLTALFKNREGHLVFHASLSFNKEKQAITVDHYKLQVDSKSWILDKTLETIANNFVYRKLKSKMAVEFKPLIGKRLESLNQKLRNRFEARDGIFITGSLEDFKVVKLIPGTKEIFVLIELEGKTLIEIQRLMV